MVAQSRIQDRAFRGVDLDIGLDYVPPQGEALADIEISVALWQTGRPPVSADRLEFNRTSGEIVATWEEATTAAFIAGAKLEARFVRKRGDRTRVFYIRGVQVE